MKALATGQKPWAFWFFFFLIIIILSSHSNVKEEKERGGWSHFWPSFSQLLKLFWFLRMEPCREGAGNSANCMHALISPTWARGASLSQRDSPVGMLLSLVSWVYANLICGTFSIARIFGLPPPLPPHSTSLKGLKPSLKIPASCVPV